MKRLTLSFPWPFTSGEIDELLVFIFEVSFVLYAILVVAEYVSPGIVHNFFDTQILLWIMIGLGVLSSVFPNIGQLGDRSLLSWKRKLVIPLPYAVFAGYLTMHITQGSEVPSLVLSVGSGIVVYIVLLWSSQLVVDKL